MPVDFSNHGGQRVKRARGELSCAECTRLKVRCDKKVPCGSCVRRGCPTICPNDSLSGGQGTRFVLANTEQLHKKVFDMSERIRSLEDALESTQFSHSSNPHPLLRDDLKAIKRGIEVPDSKRPNVEMKDVEVLDDFGLLSVSDRGVSRFLGRSAGTESLLTLITCAELSTELPRIDPHSFLPTTQLPTWLYKSPIATPADMIIVAETQLPTPDRGSSLCEIYLQRIGWLTRPVTRLQLIDEVFSPIYKRMAARSTGKPSRGSDFDVPDANHVHDIALLFMVFALGAALDTTLPTHNYEAEHYHQASRYLISLETMSEHPSLVIVQTLCLLGVYDVLFNRRRNTEIASATVSLASSFAAAIGLRMCSIFTCTAGMSLILYIMRVLDRDPLKWNLEPDAIQRRRHVFWQIFSLDVIQSLENGRPTIFAEHYRDCGYPEDEERKYNDDGNVESGYWNARYRFASEISFPISHISCSVLPLQYERVLEMDKKVKDFKFPSYLEGPTDFTAVKSNDVLLFMQRFTIKLFRHLMLLYLHRSFFAKALLDHPLQPLRSKYGKSFTATYECALAVIEAIGEACKVRQDVDTRSWMLWKHSFGALIIIGSIAIRGPKSEHAEKAVVELARGLELFEAVAGDGCRGRYALTILQSLREKAYEAFRQTHGGQLPSGVPEPKKTDNSSIYRSNAQPEWLDLVTSMEPSTESSTISTQPYSSVHRSDSYLPLTSTINNQLPQNPCAVLQQRYTENILGSIPCNHTGGLSPAGNILRNTSLPWDMSPSSSAGPYGTTVSGMPMPTGAQSATSIPQGRLFDPSISVGAGIIGGSVNGLLDDCILQGMDPRQQQTAEYFATLGGDNVFGLGNETGDMSLAQNASLGSGETWMSFAMDAGLLDSWRTPIPDGT